MDVGGYGCEHQVSAGLVLLEVAVECKENEIVEAGGQYLWTAKGNQPRTEWAIEKLFVHEVANRKIGAPLSKDF